MSILIKGVEIPKGANTMYLITPEGDVWELGDLFGDDKLIEGAKAVPVPPHGDLIDRDALMKGKGRYIISFGKEGIDVAEINRAPTVIPAEEGET